VYHKTGEPRRHKPKQKHPIKIFVWGGISTRGATDVVTFSGTMDAELYMKILSVALLPCSSKTVFDIHCKATQQTRAY
jgi:hypothetical protein